jgi:hypothetical protein
LIGWAASVWAPGERVDVDPRGTAERRLAAAALRRERALVESIVSAHGAPDDVAAMLICIG